MIEFDADGLKYEALEKGDYISIDVLRKITGLDPYENSKPYEIALLRIRGQIERKRQFHVRGDGYALRVLNDTEAVYYDDATFNRGVRAQERAEKRSGYIDESELDPETRAAHRRLSNQRSRVIQAQKSEYKRIRVEEKKVERPIGPLEKEIKIFSTGKDKTEDGTSTTENQTDGSGAVNTQERVDGEPAE